MAAEEETGDAKKTWNWAESMKTIFNQRSVAAHATHLIPHLKPHYRILDVGCGSGSLAVDLARHVPDGEVIGIDVNPDSVETARSFAEHANVKNIHFQVGNAEDLHEFDADSFDVVHAHQVLLHLANPKKALQEMRRLVKPGGILATRDNASLSLIPEIPGIQKNMQFYHQLSRSRGADPFYGRVHHIAAHEVGFSWEQIEMSSWGFEWSAEETKAAVVAGATGATRGLLMKAGLATEADCDEIDEGWKEWGRSPEGRYMALDSALICWR